MKENDDEQEKVKEEKEEKEEEEAAADAKCWNKIEIETQEPKYK